MMTTYVSLEVGEEVGAATTPWEAKQEELGEGGRGWLCKVTGEAGVGERGGDGEVDEEAWVAAPWEK